MTKIDKSITTGLTKDKKEVLRKAMGAASSKVIDLNKIRDELNNINIANMKLTKEQIMASSERLSYDDDSDLQDFYKKIMQETKNSI